MTLIEIFCVPCVVPTSPYLDQGISSANSLPLGCHISIGTNLESPTSHINMPRSRYFEPILSATCAWFWTPRMTHTLIEVSCYDMPCWKRTLIKVFWVPCVCTPRMPHTSEPRLRYFVLTYFSLNDLDRDILCAMCGPHITIPWSRYFKCELTTTWMPH